MESINTGNNHDKGKSGITSNRQTTLKWNSNGELSSMDMAKIIDRLSKKELSSCDIEPKSKEEE